MTRARTLKPGVTTSNLDLSIVKPMECPTCEGSGNHYEEHPFGDTYARETLTCPDCMGTGVMNSTRMKRCDECSGRGSKLVKHTHVDGPSFPENVMCMACRGEGMVRDSQFSLEESKRYFAPPKQTDAQWYEAVIKPGAVKWGYECPCCSVKVHYSPLTKNALSDSYDVVASCGCVVPVRICLPYMLLVARDEHAFAKAIMEKVQTQRETEYAVLAQDTSKMDNETFVRHMKRKRKA